MSLQRTKELILSLRPVAVWPQMVELVERIDPSGLSGVLDYPTAACEAVGGSPEEAVPGVAAVLCSLISIHLVDDILDEDPAGDYRRLGFGATANLALAFQAAGQQILNEVDLPPKSHSKLQEILSGMALATAHGQSLDVRDFRDEEEYWRVASSKTSPLFAAAASIGALLGGASPEVADQLGRLGRLLGLSIQVSDDLLDAFCVPAAADWSRRLNNLPILYAMTAEHSDREAFLELSAHASEPEALAAAQEILVRCGALSYCVFKILEILGEARALLSSVPLTSSAPVLRLFETQIRPLRHLLAAAGTPNMDAFLFHQS